jgi:tRNA 2-thiouridine synthesizing protein C
MKSLLCIISQPPYRNSHVLESIEAAMVAAVFDFDVSLLFRGEGLWSLMQAQEADALGLRSISKVLSALATYDIKSVYVSAEDLTALNLSLSDLCLSVTALEHQAQAQLIGRQDAVLGCGA